jgi:hypothetical protein
MQASPLPGNGEIFLPMDCRYISMPTSANFVYILNMEAISVEKHPILPW